MNDDLKHWANNKVRAMGLDMRKCGVGVCRSCGARSIWSPITGPRRATCRSCGVEQILDFYTVEIHSEND